MKSTLIILLYCASSVLSQNFPVKRITNENFDTKNLMIITNGWSSSGVYLFEGVQNNKWDIFWGSYNAEDDIFYPPQKLTDNQFDSKNGSVLLEKGGLIYQTNKMGNWDLAYREYSPIDSSWSEEILLTQTPEDEYQPTSFFNAFGQIDIDEIAFLFRTDSAVCYFSKKDSVTIIDTLFKDMRAFLYTDFHGMTFPWVYPPQLFATAVKTDSSDFYYLVYRSKSIYESEWGEEKLIDSAKHLSSPKFLDLYWNPVLSVNMESGSGSMISLYEIGSYYIARDSIWIENGTPSDLSSDAIYIVTKPAETADPQILNAHSYKIKNTSGTFIKLIDGYDYYYEENDSLVQIKYEDSRLKVTFIGFSGPEISYYTFWEDSLDGVINIFGYNDRRTFTDIKDENISFGFELSQNYPNPFNPKTNIKWSSHESGHVILKVYDILGREAAVLVNEFRPAGNYIIEFNALELTSGVYVYTLISGNSNQTKKMLLLK